MDESLFPNPDFWISALYKRLVSTTVRLFSRSILEGMEEERLSPLFFLKVLRVKMDDERRSDRGDEEKAKTTRLYAHCGKIKDTLVLFGLNMVYSFDE